jgi:hypothetical protein
MYCATRSIKTTKAREWTMQVLHALNEPSIKEALADLRKAFNIKKHTYGLDLTFNYPSQVFKNKAGLISSKTMDISNVEKPLIDLLFLQKYFDLESPNGAENLNIDDKFLTELCSRKQSGEYYSIDITIKLLDL